jgi:hypothetical protein
MDGVHKEGWKRTEPNERTLLLWANANTFAFPYNHGQYSWGALMKCLKWPRIHENTDWTSKNGEQAIKCMSWKALHDITKICCCDLNVCKDSLGITRKQSQHAKGSFVENKHLHSWEITKGIRNCKNDAEHQSICRSTSTRWTGDRTLNIHRRVNQYQCNSWDLFEHRLIKNYRIFYCQEMQPTQSGNTKVVEPLKWTKWQKKKVFKTTFRRAFERRIQWSICTLVAYGDLRNTSPAWHSTLLSLRKNQYERFSARKERWSYTHRRNRSVEAHIPGTCVEKHIDCEKFVGDTAQSRKWVPWHSWMVRCNDEL